jgi:predicted dehydrogenase
MIGDVIGATTRYCTGGIWYRGRKEGMSDAEFQLNNWMHFIWLSGDQIVEQAVHNIDTINWVMDGPPVSAFGSGGRFTRPDDSEMWDSMSIDYEYPGNRIVSVICRQIPGSANDVGNVIYGSKGQCHIGASSSGSRIVDRAGNEIWKMDGSIADAYRQEHKDLIDSIRAGKPIVELRQTADSSLTAVQGRLAAYTGQRVSWEFLTKESKLDLFPKHLAIDAELPEPGHAIPGKTKLV